MPTLGNIARCWDFTPIDRPSISLSQFFALQSTTSWRVMGFFWNTDAVSQYPVIYFWIGALSNASAAWDFLALVFDADHPGPYEDNWPPCIKFQLLENCNIKHLYSRFALWNNACSFAQLNICALSPTIIYPLDCSVHKFITTRLMLPRVENWQRQQDQVHDFIHVHGSHVNLKRSWYLLISKFIHPSR